MKRPALIGRAPGLFPNAYAPAWLTEGLAVFYESRLTGAGRLEGSFHRAIVGAASAEHPDLTKSRWGLRMTPTADKRGLVTARLANKLQLKTAAVLAEDNEAIRLTIRTFKAEYEKLGGKLVGEETFKIGDTSMRAQLTKLRAARPDALYIEVSSAWSDIGRLCKPVAGALLFIESAKKEDEPSSEGTMTSFDSVVSKNNPPAKSSINSRR